MVRFEHHLKSRVHSIGWLIGYRWRVVGTQKNPYCFFKKGNEILDVKIQIPSNIKWEKLKSLRDNLCVLGNILGEKPRKRYLDCGFAYCARIALRYVCRNETVGPKGHFHFVKKQGENKGKKRLPQRQGVEKKKWMDWWQLSWVSHEMLGRRCGVRG